MSPVELWANSRWWNQAVLRDFDWLAGISAKQLLIVVESQDEYDYCWAMQLIAGFECKIIIKDDDLHLPDCVKMYSWVITTWDPSDRNRI
jgi:hypothetical protein